MNGVREVLGHSVLVLVATAFCCVGWVMAHNPERTFRAFTFRAEPGPRVLVGFLRLCGWTFATVFGVAAIIFLGEVAYDLLRAH
jgi:hypothetical protein